MPHNGSALSCSAPRLRWWPKRQLRSPEYLSDGLSEAVRCQLQRLVGQRACLQGWVSASTRVPKGEDLDPIGFCIDLVVEVVAGAAQEKTPKRPLL
jgi:hypothetical protein